MFHISFKIHPFIDYDLQVKEIELTRLEKSERERMEQKIKNGDFIPAGLEKESTFIYKSEGSILTLNHSQSTREISPRALKHIKRIRSGEIVTLESKLNSILTQSDEVVTAIITELSNTNNQYQTINREQEAMISADVRNLEQEINDVESAELQSYQNCCELLDNRRQILILQREEAEEQYRLATDKGYYYEKEKQARDNINAEMKQRKNEYKITLIEMTKKYKKQLKILKTLKLKLNDAIEKEIELTRKGDKKLEKLKAEQEEAKLR